MVFRVEYPVPDGEGARELLFEHVDRELGYKSSEDFESWYGPPMKVKNAKSTTTNHEVPWPTDDGDIIVRLVYPEALEGDGAMVLSNPDRVYVIDATLPSHARGGYLAVHGLDMMSEDSQGPDHPGVATRLNSLALLLASDGRVQEAEEMYRRALDIARKVYGPEHADVATYLNNLARVLKAQDKLGEAEPLQRSALSIGERMLGTNHSDVATYYNNLSRLVRAAGKLEETEPLQRRAVEIGEQVLGPNSSDLATWVNNLGRLLMARKKLEEAKEVQERAVAIAENVYGPDHPQVARARKNLTKVQVALDKADRSRGSGAPDTDMDA